MLSAISMAESGGDPTAANVTDRERSYGLFQINLNAHNLTPQQAMDPAASAQYALKLAREQGYTPWSVFTNGAYKQFLGGSSMPNDWTGDPGAGDFSQDLAQGAQVGAEATLPPGSNAIPIYGTGNKIIAYRIPSGSEFLPDKIISVQEATGQTDTPLDYAKLGLDQARLGLDQQQVQGTLDYQRNQYLVSRANTLLNALGTLVDMGKLSDQQAINQFNSQMDVYKAEFDAQYSQADLNFKKSGLDLQKAGLQDQAAAWRAGQATDRGRILAQDVLPSFIPGATSLTLPLLGTMPLPQVNPSTFFDQFGAPPITQQSMAQFPNIPDVPTLPPPPNITYQPQPIPTMVDLTKMFSDLGL